MGGVPWVFCILHWCSDRWESRSPGGLPISALCRLSPQSVGAHGPLGLTSSRPPGWGGGSPACWALEPGRVGVTVPVRREASTRPVTREGGGQSGPLSALGRFLRGSLRDPLPGAALQSILGQADSGHRGSTPLSPPRKTVYRSKASSLSALQPGGQDTHQHPAPTPARGHRGPSQQLASTRRLVRASGPHPQAPPPHPFWVTFGKM